MSRRLPRPLLPRVLGAVTAAYSLAIVIRPEVLARPCGMVGTSGRASRSVRVLVAAVGVRDVASGVAMMTAPDGPPLRRAITARVVADAGDAVVFGLGLTDPATRATVAGFAACWAALCAASAGTVHRS